MRDELTFRNQADKNPGENIVLRICNVCPYSGAAELGLHFKKLQKIILFNKLKDPRKTFCWEKYQKSLSFKVIQTWLFTTKCVFN